MSSSPRYLREPRPGNVPGNLLYGPRTKLLRKYFMRSFIPFRRCLTLALAGLLACAAGSVPAQMSRGWSRGPAFHMPMQKGAAQQARRQPGYPPPAQRQAPGPGPAQRGGGQKNEHLAQWMNQHSNLSPAQQQQALENEPGFRELPAQTQQNMRNRLAQLNAMPPQQRERVLNRNEAMERLTPEQRGQVRGAMEQLGGLPPDQRRFVARSFRELRELPPNERQAALNSPRYAGQMNDAQRATLNNLLRVEPMLPPPEPRQ
jgi:hypothetical protein